MARYDAACAQAQAETKGKGVILVVIDGEQGTDVSLQCDAQSMVRMPELLERVAKDIRDHMVQALTAAWSANANTNGRTRPVEDPPADPPADPPSDVLN